MCVCVCVCVCVCAANEPASLRGEDSDKPFGAKARLNGRNRYLSPTHKREKNNKKQNKFRYMVKHVSAHSSHGYPCV